MKNFKFIFVCALLFLSVAWASPHNFGQSIPSKETVQAKEKEPIMPDVFLPTFHSIRFEVRSVIVGKTQIISSTEYLRNYFKYKGKPIPFRYIYENRLIVFST